LVWSTSSPTIFHAANAALNCLYRRIVRDATIFFRAFQKKYQSRAEVGTLLIVSVLMDARPLKTNIREETPP
jgi:UDP-N-acetylglucosamine:LPS N-acetylglucosamine transferase